MDRIVSLSFSGPCLPQVLKELRVFGVHDMAVPPSKCLLYRSVDARELFTQPCLLGTALQCVKGEPCSLAARPQPQACTDLAWESPSPSLPGSA